MIQKSCAVKVLKAMLRGIVKVRGWPNSSAYLASAFQYQINI